MRARSEASGMKPVYNFGFIGGMSRLLAAAVTSAAGGSLRPLSRTFS